MVDVTVPIGQLVFHVRGYERVPGAPGLEAVTVEIGVENRASGLGDALQPPAAELRDGEGRVYALASEDAWSEPLQPNTSADAALAFEVPVDAASLELVLAPGTEDEVAIPLA